MAHSNLSRRGAGSRRSPKAEQAPACSSQGSVFLPLWPSVAHWLSSCLQDGCRNPGVTSRCRKTKWLWLVSLVGVREQVHLQPSSPTSLQVPVGQNKPCVHASTIFSKAGHGWLGFRQCPLNTGAENWAPSGVCEEGMGDVVTGRRQDHCVTWWGLGSP